MEIYISTDIETDGPIPGPHSMLSIGSAAYLEDKTLVSTFEANLETLSGAEGHPETMEWWDRNRKAYRKTRVDPEPPEVVMPRYVEWVKSLRRQPVKPSDSSPEESDRPDEPSGASLGELNTAKPVFVAYPAGFDFTFVYWYLIKFAGESPFSHSCLDMKTFAMSLMGSEYRSSTKRNMPRHWFDKLPHTHQALDDAIEQGALFCNMLADWKAQLGERGE